MYVEMILSKMAESKNFFGLGAKQYINDPILGPEFILECYSQIYTNEQGMINCIGVESVKQIKGFYKKTFQS